MAEGDEISDVCRETNAGKGCSIVALHHSPLHRFINTKLDMAMDMFGRKVDEAHRHSQDPLEETPEEELADLEQARQDARNPEHPGEQMSGTL